MVVFISYAVDSWSVGTAWEKSLGPDLRQEKPRATQWGSERGWSAKRSAKD